MSFEHAGCEIILRHPGGGVQKAIANMDLEFRKQSGRVMLTGKLSRWKQQRKLWNEEVLPNKLYSEKRRVTEFPTSVHGFLIWLIHQNPHLAQGCGTQPIFS